MNTMYPITPCMIEIIPVLVALIAPVLCGRAKIHERDGGRDLPRLNAAFTSLNPRKHRKPRRLGTRAGYPAWQKAAERPPQSRPVSAFGNKRPCRRCTVSSTLE